MAGRVKRDIDGDLVIAGNLTVLGGLNEKNFIKTRTELASTKQDVSSFSGRIDEAESKANAASLATYNYANMKKLQEEAHRTGDGRKVYEAFGRDFDTDWYHKAIKQTRLLPGRIEIELGSEHEVFAKPGWAGVEATHAPRYYNLALASRPYSQWREDEQRACDLNQGH